MPEFMIGKIAFLFLGIWMTIVNAHLVGLKNSIPAPNFIYQAVGVVGFITLQWLI